MKQLLSRQSRHYRNTRATELFGNIGMECLVRFEVNFFHTLPQKPLKLVPFRTDPGHRRRLLQIKSKMLPCEV